MIKIGYLPLIGLVVCLLSSCAHGKQSAEPDALAVKAKGFVTQVSKGDFSRAVSSFDETMRAAAPPERVAEIWKSLAEQHGPFVKIARTRTENSGGYSSVTVVCQFKKSSAGLKVVFNGTGQISGLWMAPAEAASDYKAPDYAKKSAFTEKQVTVGSGKWSLPGTLTLPKGKGPFPAVILVHGSGPNDRDESVGANKPFRDLAWGLASRGVAVLRYEKRTKQCRAEMVKLGSNVTVKEETIDDAVAAAALLRKTKEINPKKIFVLGHSLGGMLIPRIANADPKVCGLIVMAGATRPIEDAVVEQMQYLASLDGEISKDDQARIDQCKLQAARIKDPDLSPATPAAELPFGVPAQYWLDLRNYKPAEAAKGLKSPMLILQGERDYQVTMKDFEGWKSELSSRKNVSFKLYPKLNHLFVAGEGKSVPAEYEKPGHVSKTVIVDIADWIKKQ